MVALNHVNQLYSEILFFINGLRKHAERTILTSLSPRCLLGTSSLPPGQSVRPFFLMNFPPGTSGPHRRHSLSCSFANVAHYTAHNALHIGTLAKYLADQATWYTRVPPFFCEVARYSIVGTGQNLLRKSPSEGQQVVSNLVTKVHFAARPFYLNLLTLHV